MDTKLDASQQHALLAKKVEYILGCIRKSVDSRIGQVILLYCAVVRHIWSAGSSAGLSVHMFLILGVRDKCEHTESIEGDSGTGAPDVLCQMGMLSLEKSRVGSQITYGGE